MARALWRTSLVALTGLGHCAPVLLRETEARAVVDESRATSPTPAPVASALPTVRSRAGHCLLERRVVYTGRGFTRNADIEAQDVVRPNRHSGSLKWPAVKLAQEGVPFNHGRVAKRRFNHRRHRNGPFDLGDNLGQSGHLQFEHRFDPVRPGSEVGKENWAQRNALVTRSDSAADGLSPATSQIRLPEQPREL